MIFKKGLNLKINTASGLQKNGNQYLSLGKMPRSQLNISYKHGLIVLIHGHAKFTNMAKW